MAVGLGVAEAGVFQKCFAQRSMVEYLPRCKPLDCCRKLLQVWLSKKCIYIQNIYLNIQYVLQEV